MDEENEVKTNIETPPFDSMINDGRGFDKYQYLDKINTMKEYIGTLESQVSTLKEQLNTARESEDRIKQQYLEANRREHFLLMRLSGKDQEIQNLMV